MTQLSSAFTNYLLAELKCASIRARLIVNEIDAIGVALRGNFICTDDAIAWLQEAGALGLISSITRST
jgi:hypothetical protein